MFTGIVAAVGRIDAVTPIDGDADSGIRVRVVAPELDLSDVAIGDSIAIQGACMTVVAKAGTSFDVDISRESLNKTVGLDAPGEVNLEKAMRPHDRLGGHMVSGHVDGLGTVTHFAPVGESHELRILAPAELGKFLAYKGSITVNGVSLTVNRVTDQADGCEFSINLIPHTVAVTTLRHLQAGSQVNLEIDLIARYVERMLSAPPTPRCAEQ
ncbi:riboflavin synthase [Pandoraea sp.]|uniref:riboflavin synthase n=1 Tax=Pandoraea sp. TaxID=1883445 RepID=UPI0011F5A304|nr:riboflavin synthase [Pandoraea sp.]TAL56487.1 MAG: riboflavin synthase [Pandoraea sp.]TAM15306.1 MAG: riboflavin synthase [Pandoraea sp.]